MEVKKAIKKMVALGTGLAMVGATIFGAAAADLSDYPSPMFIQDGKLNGVIVVGDSAAASDVIGSVDIATSLQYSATTVAEVAAGGAVEPTISQGVKIVKSGNDLNFGEDIDDVQPTALDESDLPEVLMEGEFEDTEGNTDNTETYTQELLFGNATATLVFDQDKDGLPEAGDALFIDKGTTLYTYTLEFDDSIEYDAYSSETIADDFEGATLDIQGRMYTITDVQDTAGWIDEITLQVGETTMWLEEGVEITKSIAGVSHTVVLQDVNEEEDKCGILVDGTLAWVDKDKTKVVNGVSIGVTDAIVVHSAGKDTDVCEVNLGAEEIVLSDDDEVEINGDEIDGSNVEINTTLVAFDGDLDYIKVSFEPEEDVWLKSGQEYVDPVFSNWMVKYAGLTKVTEIIEFDSSTDSAELIFMSVDSKEVEIPFFCTAGCDTAASDQVLIATGDDIDEQYLLAGDVCTSLDVPADVTDCEGAVVIIQANGEAHLVEINDIDESGDKIVMKDLTYGGTTKETTYINGTETIIALPSGAGTVKLTIDESAGTVTVGAGGAIDDHAYVEAVDQLETEMGALITLNNEKGVIDLTATGVGQTILVDEDGDMDGDGVLGTITVTLNGHSDDEEIRIKGIAVTTGLSWHDESETNDNTNLATTLYGTLLSYDAEDEMWLEIDYPEEEVFGNAFVAPTTAQVTAGGAAGTITTTVVQKIQVGAAKLASEVADITAINAIVVGGPCANAAAATLMGNPEKCWEAIPENKAIIKLYESGANVALLVAGRTALDTRRAARVLANYDDYDMSGSEVQVTGTSLTDISVSAPQ